MMSSAGISRPKSTSVHTLLNRTQRRIRTQAADANLCTTEDLHQCLYQRNQVISVSKDDFRTSRLHKEEVFSYWCKGCRLERTEPCQFHDPQLSFKLTTSENHNNNTNNKNVNLPNAVESFPNEVGLCISSIPGAGYGVCAKQIIPVGTWIGPYEGELVRPEEVVLGCDASYMWEIFHEGKLLYYIDGSNENKSSWMRYIRCARNGTEQNMYAFQYCGNIYYRAFRDIPTGGELLVWYDEKYPQYMGIPLEICEISFSNPVDQRQHPEMVVVIPHDNPNPGSCHSKESSSSPWKDNLQFTTRVRSILPSREQSRVKRCLSNNTSNRGESLRAYAEEYKRVRHVSWTADGTPLQTSTQMTENSLSSEEARSKPVSPVQHFGLKSVHVQKIPNNNRRDLKSSGGKYSNGSKMAPSSIDEKHAQLRSTDEDEISSDGSDANFFNCGQCGKSFAQRSVLQIHVCPNMPRKPYHCGQCSQTFDHPNELRTHAVIHVGEKPFKCGYCSRSFAGATTLHNHVRTHTGEKPFLCERCGKNFTQASQLHKHENIPGDCVPYDGLPD